MIPYLLAYLFASVFSFCYSKSRDKSTIVIFASLTFLTLFLPLALRYGIGTDYENYVRIVSNGLNLNYYTMFELGWAPLVYFIDSCALDVHWFFVIISGISTIVLFAIVPRKYFFTSIPIYICTSWIASFSLVRQAFASLIFLVALKKHLLGKNVQAAFWGSIAGLFHTSLFLPLCLLPLCRLRWRCFTPVFNGAALLFLSATFALSNIGTVLFDSVIALTPYSSYINTIYNSKTELGSGLGVLLKVFVLFLFLVSFQRDSSQKKDRAYSTLCMFALVQGLFIILSAQVRILGRLTNIFDGVYVFFIMYLSQSKSKYRTLLMYFITFSFFLMYVKSLISNPSSADGGMGLTPYQSIFSR